MAELRLTLNRMQHVGRDFLELCKPRVVALMMLTTLIGMHLATPGWVPLSVLCFGLLGIGLCASSAAAINHLIDRQIDQQMHRTKYRPVASGRISPNEALSFAIAIGLLGLGVLIAFVNTLTAVLTFFTLIGYALVYTVILKRATSQNIVIGGIAGAAPPLLGWVAVSGSIDAYSLLPVLIIYTWTPPHFWALAIHRHREYQQAKLPMLPVTHGVAFTKLCIVLYTLLLLICSLLPTLTGMSGWLYGGAAIVLGLGYLGYGIQLFFDEDNRCAMPNFYYSIFYLAVLFLVLWLDHYVR